MITVLSLSLMGRCTDPWDERTSLNDGVPSSVLLDEIKSNPDLSKFADLLASTGLDKELAASKTFTVWAPNNAAFDAVVGDLPTDSLLEQLLLNHISYERVNYDGVSEELRHKMANGKYMVLNTDDRTIDGVTLVDDEDNVAKNGVLHVIPEVLEVKMNIWEYLEATASGKQADYILNQNVDIFDASIADQTGVDPNTGAPIYDTISGLRTVNAYIENVVDIDDEDELVTYFVLSDATLESEVARFKKYYVKQTETMTDSLTTWYVLRDVVVDGELSLDDLNGVITSLDGVSFTVNQSSIESTYNASNGIVYVLNDLNVDIEERVKPIMIEAEFPYPDTVNILTNNFFRIQPDVNDRYNLYTRARSYASNGYDIYFPSGHGLNPGYIDFFIDKLNTVKYEMYWVSVHEVLDSEGLPEDTVSYTQSLFNMDWQYNVETEEIEMIHKDTIATGVLPNYIDNAVETSLGVLSVDTLSSTITISENGLSTTRDQWIYLRVQGSGSNTPISLDYIKMVPVIE